MPDYVVQNGITIRETGGREATDRVDGRSVATRTFLCEGSYDPVVCINALKDAPIWIDTYGGLVRSAIGTDRAGPQSWELSVEYDALEPEVGDFKIVMDSTVGGTVKQTNAYAQVAYPASGESAPDFGTAIDVQDGKPQGVDRIIPGMKINVIAKIAKRHIVDAGGPAAYSELVAGLRGYTNDIAYLGYAARKLLFHGATGPILDDDDPKLTFIFEVGVHLSNVTIGDISGISKEAHDYMWTLPKRGVDATTGLPVSVPRAQYVSRIYGPASFSAFKIGES